MLYQGEFYCLKFETATAADALAVFDDSYAWWDQVKCYVELRRQMRAQPWWYEFDRWIPFTVRVAGAACKHFLNPDSLSWFRTSQRPKVSQ